MSLDIIILKLPDHVDVEDLDALDVEPEPLGDRSHVVAVIQRAFPSARPSGPNDFLLIDAEVIAVEFHIPPEEPISSLHVTVRVGRDWSSVTIDPLEHFLGTLCANEGWSAYDVGGNERVFPPVNPE